MGLSTTSIAKKIVTTWPRPAHLFQTIESSFPETSQFDCIVSALFLKGGFILVLAFLDGEQWQFQTSYLRGSWGITERSRALLGALPIANVSF